LIKEGEQSAGIAVEIKPMTLHFLYYTTRRPRFFEADMTKNFNLYFINSIPLTFWD
jgi:hypothetical protein